MFTPPPKAQTKKNKQKEKKTQTKNPDQTNNTYLVIIKSYQENITHIACLNRVYIIYIKINVYGYMPLEMCPCLLYSQTHTHTHTHTHTPSRTHARARVAWYTRQTVASSHSVDHLSWFCYHCFTSPSFWYLMGAF